MSHETQQSITAWADETFGPVSSNFRVAARANEEMAELLRALSAGNEEKAKEEAADVVIVLARLATRLESGIEFFEPDEPANSRHTWYANEANLAMARLLWLLEHCPEHIDAPACMQLVVDQLGSLSNRLGTNLQTEINKKMVVNRARVWKKDGSGHGYHVRDVK